MGNRHDEGLEERTKTSVRHPRDRHVGELITVFRDNYEPARSCAIYPACIVPLVIACTASPSHTDTHTHANVLISAREEERRGEER